jgi:long-chain acyl-CoA synthetase
MTTMDWTIPSTLSDVARAQPGLGDKIALSDGAQTLSYADLDRQIDAAHGVYAALGLMPGDRVVLLLPASTSFVAAYFGAHRAGLILIPLNPLLGTDEIGFILSTMRPALVLAAATDAPFPVMAALDDLVVALDPAPRLVRIADFVASMADAPTDRPAIVRHPDDEALILFTSGTSGRPKGASHREGALITNGRHSNGVLGIGPDDVLLCPLPLSHVFGQIVLMLGGLMAGGEVVIVARPSPDAVLAAMTERQVTIMAAVPTIFAALAEKGRSDPDAGHAAARRLRFAFAGGAPLPPATGEAFRASFGVPVHQGYGMTEVACCIALESHALPPSGGVGRLCTTLDHRIVPISADTPDEGELEIAGPNLMRGYYVDGQLQPRPAAQWFPTGDIVRRDGDGNIFLFDRKKEMIIRNGYNVYPSEVEAALASHPAVLLAAVIGVEDAAVGQDVAAFVSLREGASATPMELANWCRARIALYKYPRFVAIMERLPTNATGKILKRALDPALLCPVDSL